MSSVIPTRKNPDWKPSNDGGPNHGRVLKEQQEQLMHRVEAARKAVRNNPNLTGCGSTGKTCEKRERSPTTETQWNSADWQTPPSLPESQRYEPTSPNNFHLDRIDNAQTPPSSSEGLNIPSSPEPNPPPHEDQRDLRRGSIYPAGLDSSQEPKAPIKLAACTPPPRPKTNWESRSVSIEREPGSQENPLSPPIDYNQMIANLRMTTPTPKRSTSPTSVVQPNGSWPKG